MEYGRDPYAVLRQALRGHARSVSILFQRHEGHDDVPMTLLWRRGEPIDIVLDRVRAIPVDPTAGTALRGAMLGCFEGLDRWLPRCLRQELIALIDDEAINVEQVALDDAVIADPSVRDLVEGRWSVTSPLRRAARAALAHLESWGIGMHTVHLHGQNIGKPLPSYYVGFELRHLPSVLYCLENTTDANGSKLSIPHANAHCGRCEYLHRTGRGSPTEKEVQGLFSDDRVLLMT